MIDADHPAAQEHSLQWGDHISPQGAYGLPGQDEVLLVEVPHAPADERE
jgi:hypothetical protein